MRQTDHLAAGALLRAAAGIGRLAGSSGRCMPPASYRARRAVLFRMTSLATSSLGIACSGGLDAGHRAIAFSTAGRTRTLHPFQAPAHVIRH